MKKIVTHVLVLALLITCVFSGCGQSGQTTSDATSETSKAVEISEPASSVAENVTINFYYWDESQKVGMNAIVDGFMAKNPNIKVESTVIPFTDYMTKLKTSLPSGSGPDVFWINKTGFDLIDYIEPIDDKVAADGIDMNNFASAIVKMYTKENKLYGIPKDVDAPALFYNKAIFDEMGVDYPTDDWKWADLKNAAKNLTKGDVYGYISHCGTYDTIYNFFPCNGAPLYSDDFMSFTGNTQSGVDTLNYMLSFIIDKSSPTQAIINENGASNLFTAGKGAMIVSGSWMLPTYYDVLKKDLGIAMVPYGAVRSYQSNGLAFSMSKAGNNKDASWELLKYCATQEGQEAQAGVVIPAYIGSTQKWVDSYPNIKVDSVIEALKYSEPMYFAAKSMNECTSILKEVMSNIWTQSVTPEEGLADIEKRINDLLK